MGSLNYSNKNPIRDISHDNFMRKILKILLAGLYHYYKFNIHYKHIYGWYHFAPINSHSIHPRVALWHNILIVSVESYKISIMTL